MKTYQTLTCISFWLLTIPLLSQTPLSGVINHYTNVNHIDSCAGRLTVADASFFNKGDQVLIIQMKGATIDQSNNSSFGNIAELGCAGCYEKNEISGVIGSQIYLRYTLANHYNVSGSVQMITLPRLVDAKVVDTLTTQPWDGTIGGVLALEVTKTLTLEAPVDVSGKGFRGGSLAVVSSDCNFLTNANDHYYGAISWKGAPKGEGIAELLPNKEKGRGAQANGGGGGNDHNTGGGGGSNISFGGGGGKHNASGNFSCPGESPGKGGKPLPQLNNHLFMGGGGGAGHVDNAGFGSGGGQGGGIVILIADTLKMNGHAIFANGKTPPYTGGDGAGGGGAGGTVVLDVKQLTGSAFIQAKGGNGGSVGNTSDRCFGPGGGGGGGRLLSSLMLSGNIDLAGGLPGVNTVSSGQCSNPANGAVAGNPGEQSEIPGVVQTLMENVAPVVISQPQGSSICTGQSAVFQFVVQGPFLTYQWKLGSGNNWINLQNNASVNGADSPKLTLLNATADMNGYQFRCIAMSGCTSDLLSQVAALIVTPAPQVAFSFSQTGNGKVQFTNASGPALSFHWDFGDGSSSTLENPTHTFATFGTYTVTLTVTNDCGSVSTSQQITVQTAPAAAFQAPGSSGCAPASVQFFNQSSSNAQTFTWFFPGGEPATSNEPNPKVTYHQPGSFAATLIVGNASGYDTSTIASAVVVLTPPSAGFLFSVSGLSVQFINNSTGGTGFLWNFGDGSTSTGLNPKHNFPKEGFFTVTLTAYNDCGETTVTQTISTGSFPSAAFSLSYGGGCVPVNVQFKDKSTGSNLDYYEWHFEGGLPAVSYEQNPVVTYLYPGNFDVTLTVGNALGKHTASMKDLVNVLDWPDASFFHEAAELSIKFTNTSTGADYVHWDFGDGNSSTEFSPTHTYASPGIYNVVLTVANAACGSAVAQSVQTYLTTGIVEGTEGTKILVYPNPASDELFIALEALPGKNTTIRLRDANGRLMASTAVVEKQTRITLFGLPAGIYFVEIESGEHRQWSRVVKL